MSNCFYICQRLSITNLWVFFIFVISHCQRLVFPFLQYVCFQISRREICHRQSLWSLVPVSMDTEGAGARGWKGVQYYDTPISQRSPLFSSFLLLLASICCTTEVIQLFTTFWMAVFSIFSWLARFHTLWTGSFCLSCLLRFHDSLSYYMKSANRLLGLALPVPSSAVRSLIFLYVII